MRCSEEPLLPRGSRSRAGACPRAAGSAWSWRALALADAIQLVGTAALPVNCWPLNFGCASAFHGSTPSEAGPGVFILADTPKLSSFETRGRN